MIKRDHDFLKACCSIPHPVNIHYLDDRGHVRGKWYVARTRCSKLMLAHQVYLGSFEVGREQFDPAGVTRRLSRYARGEILGVGLTVGVEGFATLTRLTFRK